MKIGLMCKHITRISTDYADWYSNCFYFYQRRLQIDVEISLIYADDGYK